MTDEDRAELKQDLIVAEGRRRDVYDDATSVQVHAPKGSLSVGIGHNLSLPMPDALIDLIYEHDIQQVIDGVIEALPWVVTLDGPRMRVLCNIAFNAGINGLLGFHKMLAALEAGDLATASTELINSQLAPGRARRLAALLQT